MPHDAFISYSHAADSELANRLEAGLQRFAKPWYRVRQLRIFRDAANLNLTPNLWDGIVSELGSASHLVYLASPEAAASKWVCKEIDYWLTNKDRQRLLIVVTKGDVAWDDQRNDFRWNVTTCMPQQLAGAFAGEPFYLDLRWARTDTDLSLQNPKFKEAVALLSATLHGKSVEDMIGEEVTQHRRMTRLRNGAIAALTMLLIAASVAAMVAVRQRTEAVQQRTEAIRQRDLAVQQSLLSRVRNDLESGSLLDAVRTARAVEQRYGSAPLAQQTLREAATHPSAVLATIREPVNSRPRVTFSPDETHLLSVSQNSYGSYGARILDWRGGEFRSFDQVYLARYAPDGRALVIGWPWAPQAASEPDGSWCDNGIAVPPVTDYAVVGLQRFALTADGAGADLPIGFQQSATGDRLRASICGNYVHLDRPDGTRVHSLRVPGVVTASFSPDASRLVVATRQRTSVYELSAAGQPTAAPTLDLEGGSPVIAADGTSLATVSGGSSILWNAAGREIQRRKGTDPGFGPDGLFVTVDGDHSLVWRDGSASDAVPVPGIAPRFSDDGQWVMTTVGEQTRVADLAGRELTTLEGVSGHFARRAPVVVTATNAGLIRLFDLRRVDAVSAAAAASMWSVSERDLTPVALPAAGALPGCLVECVSPDGVTRVSVLMTGVTPGASMKVALTVETRSADSANVPWHNVENVAKTECQSPVAPIAFSPAERGAFAVGCGNGLLSLHDSKGVARWQARHDGEILHTVFSSDGQQLMTASADRSARIWNAATGAPLAVLGGHESEVVQSAFAPRGDRVGTVTSRGVLKVWAHTDGTWSGTPLASVTLRDDAAVAATFDSDGTQVLVRTRRGFFRRWILAGAQWLKEYDWLERLSDEEMRQLGLP